MLTNSFFPSRGTSIRLGHIVNYIFFQVWFAGSQRATAETIEETGASVDNRHVSTATATDVSLEKHIRNSRLFADIYSLKKKSQKEIGLKNITKHKIQRPVCGSATIN